MQRHKIKKIVNESDISEFLENTDINRKIKNSSKSRIKSRAP